MTEDTRFHDPFHKLNRVGQAEVYNLARGGQIILSDESVHLTTWSPANNKMVDTFLWRGEAIDLAHAILRKYT